MLSLAVRSLVAAHQCRYARQSKRTREVCCMCSVNKFIPGLVTLATECDDFSELMALNGHSCRRITCREGQQRLIDWQAAAPQACEVPSVVKALDNPRSSVSTQLTSGRPKTRKVQAGRLFVALLDRCVDRTSQHSPWGSTQDFFRSAPMRAVPIW